MSSPKVIILGSGNVASHLLEAFVAARVSCGLWSHNAAHARELADLAAQLDKAGNHTAYEQVMAAVSDFEKGNMRLTVVLSSLKG